MTYNYPDNMNWSGWAVSVGDTSYMADDDWREHYRTMVWARECFKDRILDLAYYAGDQLGAL